MTTRKLTITAVMAGLGTLFVYLCSLLPSGRVAAMALSSACVCVTVMECGVSYALAGSAATALLALILAPNKLSAVIYIVLCGHYPVVKLYIERLRRIWLEIPIKLAVGFAAILIGTAAAVYVLSNAVALSPALVLTSLSVFIVYDAALTIFITFYKRRIAKHIKK